MRVMLILIIIVTIHYFADDGDEEREVRDVGEPGVEGDGGREGYDEGWVHFHGVDGVDDGDIGFDNRQPVFNDQGEI